MLDIEKVTNIALWSKGCHFKKKAIAKCSTLKVDFSANFHPIHDLFFVEALLTPQNWKQKNKVTNFNLSACNTKQT